MEELVEKAKERTGRLGNKMAAGAGNTAGDFGRGLAAGLAGTLAITASQAIEMKITGRSPSDTPVKAAGKVLGFEPRCQDEEQCKNKERLNNMVHFAYGTFWGEVRVLISSFGLKGWKASLLHFGLVWSAGMVMLPSLKVAPPVTKWGFKAIITEGLQHMVYAFAAGLIYDRLNDYSC